MKEYLPYLEYYFLKAIEYLKELPWKIVYKAIDTYNWLSDAFTGWDSQLNQFWDETKILISQGIYYLHVIIGKLRSLIYQFTDLLHELIGTMGRWR